MVSSEPRPWGLEAVTGILSVSFALVVTRPPSQPVGANLLTLIGTPPRIVEPRLIFEPPRGGARGEVAYAPHDGPSDFTPGLGAVRTRGRPSGSVRRAPSAGRSEDRVDPAQ